MIDAGEEEKMKKFLIMLLMGIMLTMGTVCFASTDGRDIDAQQKIVDIFISGKSYASIKPYMAPEMIKNFNEKIPRNRKNCRKNRKF